MPICPECHTEQAKRVRGACPNCKTRVEVHKGRWYRTEGSPAVAIQTYYYELVSRLMSRGREHPVVIRPPRRGSQPYIRELVTAERLLDATNGDFDLVKEALDILFTDSKFNWKTRSYLWSVERDFPLALGLAQSNRAAAEAKARKEDQAVSKVMSREDVFS